MGPLILEEARDAPELGQWLDGPGSYRGTQVERLPAEGLQDSSDHGSCLGIVAAEEHGGPPRGV